MSSAKVPSSAYPHKTSVPGCSSLAAMTPNAGFTSEWRLSAKQIDTSVASALSKRALDRRKTLIAATDTSFSEAHRGGAAAHRSRRSS